MMRLHGAVPSPFFRKVRIALEEKGLAYEVETLIPVPKTPQLLALNPLGKIPILQDDEVVVPDSSVICGYLERKYPRPALYPDTAPELARALFLEEYADTRMAEALGGLLFERFVKPQVLKQPTDAARVAELLATQLPPVLDYVESQVPADRDSVLTRFGIADATLGAQLGSLAFAGLEIDAARWPRTARYARALAARPSFKSASR
jgi:glutathione S-transferase